MARFSCSTVVTIALAVGLAQMACEPDPSEHATRPISTEASTDSALGCTITATQAIFVSPKYTAHAGLRNAIGAYASAVKRELRWGTKVIFLDDGTNRIDWIDRTIEGLHDTSALIAAILVGEDIDTPLFTQEASGSGGKESAFTAVWADTDHEVTQYRCDGCAGDCCRDYTPEVAISILRPPHGNSAAWNGDKLANLFTRFAKQRKNYGENVRVLMSKETISGQGIFGFGAASLANLYLAGRAETIVDAPYPTTSNMATSTTTWKVVVAAGHADPSTIQISDGTRGGWADEFRDYDLANFDPKRAIRTALFIGLGCYTSGWFTSGDGWQNDELDPPDGWNFVNAPMLNPMLRTVIGGDQVAPFVHCAAPLLGKGKTIAEAMLACDRNSAGVVMAGDPSLRFIPWQTPTGANLEVRAESIRLPKTARVGKAAALSARIRNIGNRETTANVAVYDISAAEGLVERHGAIDPDSVRERDDLRVCTIDGVAIAASSTSKVSCPFVAKHEVSTIVVIADEQGGKELNPLDNGNFGYVFAQPAIAP